MKRTNGLPLIVIGAVLILAPIVAHVITSQRDKERIAEFFVQNPSGVLLPSSLVPSGYTAYDWACFGIGVGIAFTGVGQMKRGDAKRPEKWENAEV